MSVLLSTYKMSFIFVEFEVPMGGFLPPDGLRFHVQFRTERPTFGQSSALHTMRKFQNSSFIFMRLGNNLGSAAYMPLFLRTFF